MTPSSKNRWQRSPEIKRIVQGLKHYDPERIVASAWGLREGLMMRRLDQYQLAQDPLLAGAIEFAESRGASAMQATRVAGWTVDTVRSLRPGAERLRLAAIMLGLAAMQTEPNLRVGQGVDWALHKRWIAITPEGRAMLAASICANSAELEMPEAVVALVAGLVPAPAIGAHPFEGLHSVMFMAGHWRSPVCYVLQTRPYVVVIDGSH